MTFALGTIREPQSGQSRLKTRFCDRYAEWRKLRWNLGRNAVNPQLTRKQSHQSTIWNPSPLKKSPLDKFQIVIISNKSINWISSGSYAERRSLSKCGVGWVFSWSLLALKARGGIDYFDWIRQYQLTTATFPVYDLTFTHHAATSQCYTASIKHFFQ